MVEEQKKPVFKKILKVIGIIVATIISLFILLVVLVSCDNKSTDIENATEEIAIEEETNNEDFLVTLSFMDENFQDFFGDLYLGYEIDEDNRSVSFNINYENAMVAATTYQDEFKAFIDEVDSLCLSCYIYHLIDYNYDSYINIFDGSDLVYSTKNGLKQYCFLD